jgi:hypothetical protein
MATIDISGKGRRYRDLVEQYADVRRAEIRKGRERSEEEIMKTREPPSKRAFLAPTGTTSGTGIKNRSQPKMERFMALSLVEKTKTEFEHGKDAGRGDVDPWELYSLPSFEYLSGYYNGRENDHKLAYVLAAAHKQCAPMDHEKVLASIRKLPPETIDALYMAAMTKHGGNGGDAAA